MKELKDNDYDVVFTMAVLEHIHKESEWIFPEMVKVTKDVLITIEDEKCYSWRHFPRKYNKVLNLWV